MPTIRLLAEGAAAYGSPATPDALTGVPNIPATPGEVVGLTLDYTGWIGPDDAAATSAWSSSLTLAGETLTGSVATARATIPASAVADLSMLPGPIGYDVTHTLTATSGRKRITRMRLVAA